MRRADGPVAEQLGTPGWWRSARSDPGDALASLLLTAGVPAGQVPPGLEARMALWRDRLAGKQLLLILDDAVSSEQVRPLLPGTGGSLVLVSSCRNLSALEDATAISLDTLPPGEAAALLVRLAGRPGLSSDDPAVDQMAIYRDLGNRGGQAGALTALGVVRRGSGELTQAEGCHQQALELARAIASRWDEARALAGLGRCAMADGHATQADVLLRQALEIFQRIGVAEAADVCGTPLSTRSRWALVTGS
jgi:tetratricopeptide (TPR) repeat protein